MMLANWTKDAYSKHEDELASSKEQFSFKFRKLQELKSQDQLDHLGRGSLSYLWLNKNVLTGYWKDMEGLLIMNIEKGSEIEEGVKKIHIQKCGKNKELLVVLLKRRIKL